MKFKVHSFYRQANQALRTIATVIQNLQKDIIDTLKLAVEAISRSATVMPAYAQTKIKEFIMTLPARWVSLLYPHSSPFSPFPGLTRVFLGFLRTQSTEEVARFPRTRRSL